MSAFECQAIQSYLALDIETSGLCSNTDEIIEIALAEVTSQGHVALVLQRRVRPSKPLSNAAETLLGLTNGSLAGAPTFHEIAAEIEEAISGKTIVSINTSFDRSFLEAALQDAGFHGLQNLDFIDLAGQIPARMRRKGFDGIREWVGGIDEALPLSLGLVTRAFAKLLREGEGHG